MAKTKRGEAGERVLRYQVVYDLVLRLIDEQQLKAGDRLPSTAELAARVGVSVISVRRALDELTHAGKIVRHQGVGTFVAPPRIVTTPNRSGALLKTLEGEVDADEWDTRLLGLVVGTPGPAHAAALRIEPGQPVWQIARARSVGGEPRMYETAVIPLSVAPAMDEGLLASGGSLYGYLESKFGLRDEAVEQLLEVDRPTAAEREALGVRPQDTVVRLHGVSLDAEGRPFDSFQQTYRAGDFSFYLAGPSRPRMYEPTPDGAWAVQPLGDRG